MDLGVAIPTNLSAIETSFTMAVLGDAGTGKTTFINNHLTARAVNQLFDDHAIKMHKLDFLSSRGVISFVAYDTIGQEKLGGLKPSFLQNVNCAAILFDVTSSVSFANVDLWHRQLRELCPSIPVVLVATKIDDARNRVVMPKEVTLEKKHDMAYCEVSSKLNINYSSPFLILARKLTGDVNLRFVKSPSLAPPEYGDMDMDSMPLVAASRIEYQDEDEDDNVYG